MTDRDVESHMPWCHRMSRSKKFDDLDPDDIFSAAMDSAWVACTSAPDVAIGQWKRKLFKRRVFDLRNRNKSVRMRRMCRAFGHEPADKREPEPLEIVCAIETVERLLEVQEAAGDNYAEPCSACGTTGGHGRSGGLKPRRTHGMCHSCYNKKRLSEIAISKQASRLFEGGVP